MKIFKRIWPFLFIFFVWFTLFFPFFQKGLLPIPADIIAGVYYPWLDYKWGFPTGVPVKNALLSDVPSLLYPWRSFVIDRFKEFKWPLWNPYYFGGMPLLANFQSAVFSYVNVFFLFFSKPIAWSLGVMASPILTMFVLFAFLRVKNLGVIPSLMGAVAFSLSGFQMAWLEYNVHGHTVLFFTLILLAVDRILDKLNPKKGVWLFLLPCFVAFQIFSGYLPIIIYGYIIIFFYVLFFFFLPELKAKDINWKKYINVILFVVLGLFLSSAQLFPGFELTNNSIRLIDPSVSATKASYLPLQNLITAIAPDYFGNPGTYNYFGSGFFDNFYFFIGTGTVILAFFALLKALKDKRILFWGGFLLLSLIMIFDNPLGHFLQKILFLSGGVAARALFITDFSLAILSAYGLQKIIKREYSLRQITLTCLLFVGILGLMFGNTFLIERQINRMVALRNLILPSFFLIVSLMMIILMSLKNIKLLKIKPFSLQEGVIREILALFIVLAVFSQLLYSARKYLPFSKKELIYPKTPVINFLLEEKNKSVEPFRVGINDVIPQNFLMPYGLEAASGYDALLPKRMGEFIMTLITGNVQEKISRVQFISNFDSPLFPLFNIKYNLVKKIDKEGRYTPKGEIPQPFNRSRFKLLFEDKTVVVLEDSTALPRAFLAGEVEIIRSKNEFVDLVSNKFDFSKKIVLEEQPENFLSPQLVRGRIKWLDYQPGRLRLNVTTDNPAFLLISNNYFPGWEALVDGKPTKIFRADYTFQSIFLEKGFHDVTLSYRPKSFQIGRNISFLAFFVLILAGIGIKLKIFKND